MDEGRITVIRLSALYQEGYEVAKSLIDKL